GRAGRATARSLACEGTAGTYPRAVGHRARGREGWLRHRRRPPGARSRAAAHLAWRGRQHRRYTGGNARTARSISRALFGPVLLRLRATARLGLGQPRAARIARTRSWPLGAVPPSAPPRRARTVVAPMGL